MCLSAAESVSLIIFLQAVRYGPVRGHLQSAVDRRDDFVAALVGAGAQQLQRLGADHFGHVRRRYLGNRTVVEGSIGLSNRLLVTVPIDVAKFSHPAQYVVATLHGPFR